MASTRLGVKSTSKTVRSPSPSIDSTEMPARVKSSASFRSSTGISTNSRSQLGMIFMSLVSGRSSLANLRWISQRLTTRDQRPSRKLLQKPHMSVKEQLQIGYAVEHGGDAVDTHAESEATHS